MNPAALGEDVASCFAPSADVLWHENGHALPPLVGEGSGGVSTMDDVAAWLGRAVPP
jgi:hypothetical protein